MDSELREKVGVMAGFFSVNSRKLKKLVNVSKIFNESRIVLLLTYTLWGYIL